MRDTNVPKSGNKGKHNYLMTLCASTTTSKTTSWGAGSEGRTLVPPLGGSKVYLKFSGTPHELWLVLKSANLGWRTSYCSPRLWRQPLSYWGLQSTEEGGGDSLTCNCGATHAIALCVPFCKCPWALTMHVGAGRGWALTRVLTCRPERDRVHLESASWWPGWHDVTSFYLELTRCMRISCTKPPWQFHSCATARARGSVGTTNVLRRGVHRCWWSSCTP